MLETAEYEKIIDHLQRFLLGLKQGFAFVGRQYPLRINNRDLSIDLFFYHLKLRCYVAVECKVTDCDLLDIKQIDLFLSAVDNLLRRPQDKITIGLVICKSHGKIVAEYIFRNISKLNTANPYKTLILISLPKALQKYLPSIAEMEKELSKDILTATEPFKVGDSKDENNS